MRFLTNWSKTSDGPVSIKVWHLTGRKLPGLIKDPIPDWWWMNTGKIWPIFLTSVQRVMGQGCTNCSQDCHLASPLDPQLVRCAKSLHTKENNSWRKQSPRDEEENHTTKLWEPSRFCRKVRHHRATRFVWVDEGYIRRIELSELSVPQIRRFRGFCVKIKCVLFSNLRHWLWQIVKYLAFREGPPFGENLIFPRLGKTGHVNSHITYFTHSFTHFLCILLVVKGFWNPPCKVCQSNVLELNVYSVGVSS